MMNRIPVLGVWAACCALIALIACGESGDSPTTDSGTTDGGSATSDSGNMPTGNANLTFELRYANAGQQFGATLRPLLDFLDDNTVIVLMLCETTDATCESPVVTRAITSDETDGSPIQGSFGPTITATNLPAGTYNVMIFVDSAVSIANGYGWNSGVQASETSWGGVVSDGDWMMSDVDAATDTNPDPTPVEVTLADNMTVDLSVVMATHFHERDLSPSRPTDSGRLAVAVDGGLQIIDLAQYALVEEGPGDTVFGLVDDVGSPVTGSVCGLIRGAGSTVYVLVDQGTGGVAVPFDVVAGTQLYDGNVVTFATGDNPCRGRFVDTGANQYLYVTNATANPLNAPAEGIWYAEVTALSSSSQSATFLDEDDAAILGGGVDDFAYHDGTLYLVVFASASDNGGPPACDGVRCVYDAAIGSGGSLTFDEANPLVGPALNQTYPSAAGGGSGVVPNSDLDDMEITGIEVAEFHDGRALLFLGGYVEVAVFDLDDDGAAIDYDAGTSGTQGIDGTLYGQMFTEFELSPDGNTLWAIPQNETPINFAIKDDDTRTQNDRHMALAIDLSAGTNPAAAAAFATGDIDDYEGDVFNNYTSPADDPGVDLRHAWLSVYQLAWAPDSEGSRPTTSAAPTGITFVATGSVLWLRGSGNNVSGLGKGGNLQAYDLSRRASILFNHDSDAEFHEYWLNLNTTDSDGFYFGFDLTSGTGTRATHGVAYVPTT